MGNTWQKSARRLDGYFSDKPELAKRKLVERLKNELARCGQNFTVATEVPTALAAMMW